MYSFVKLEDLVCKEFGTLANMLETIDRIEELFVLRQTDSFNVRFAFFVVPCKTLIQEGCSVRERSIFEDWYKLVDKVRV